MRMEWNANGSGALSGRNARGAGAAGSEGPVIEEENGRRVAAEGAGMGSVGGVGEGVMCMKVMTDEQMEVLRKQISVYATICEQLVEMHKAITAQQDSLAGMRLGNFYCDPLMTSGHKITARQRWTPTPMQLRILEDIFDQGNGTPSKQKIKDITQELSQHGQISETNVYNWFQNRRARSKRKQTATVANNPESEVETEVDSPQEKKAKPVKTHSYETSTPRLGDMSFQPHEMSSQAQSVNQESIKSHAIALPEDMKTSGRLEGMSFYDSMLSNPRIDQLMGKMEMSGSFNFSRTGDSYDMIG